MHAVETVVKTLSKFSDQHLTIADRYYAASRWLVQLRLAGYSFGERHRQLRQERDCNSQSVSASIYVLCFLSVFGQTTAIFWGDRRLAGEVYMDRRIIVRQLNVKCVQAWWWRRIRVSTNSLRSASIRSSIPLKGSSAHSGKTCCLCSMIKSDSDSYVWILIKHAASHFFLGGGSTSWH